MLYGLHMGFVVQDAEASKVYSYIDNRQRTTTGDIL